MKKILLFAITVLLLSACAVKAPYQDHTGPGGVLMVQAGQHVAAGEDAKAIALLERAVRIEPRNGHAWLGLARLYFASGDINKAEQFARRAMQFAGADKRLERDCQAFIGEIR